MNISADFMEKHLYFLRHATAEVARPNQLDIDRCLIEKGRLQARRVAAFLQRQGLQPQRVLTSPFPRAVQTAAIVSRDAGLAIAEEQSWLALGTPLDESQSALNNMLPELPVHTLLVGHEPDFSILISALLGTMQRTLQPVLKVKKATLSSLKVTGENVAELQWSLPCKFM